MSGPGSEGGLDEGGLEGFQGLAGEVLEEGEELLWELEGLGLSMEGEVGVCGVDGEGCLGVLLVVDGGELGCSEDEGGSGLGDFSGGHGLLPVGELEGFGLEQGEGVGVEGGIAFWGCVPVGHAACEGGPGVEFSGFAFFELGEFPFGEGSQFVFMFAEAGEESPTGGGAFGERGCEAEGVVLEGHGGAPGRVGLLTSAAAIGRLPVLGFKWARVP